MFETGLLIGLAIGALLTALVIAINHAHHKMMTRKVPPPSKHRRRVRAGVRP